MMIPKFQPDTSIPTLTQTPLVVTSMEEFQSVFQKELALAQLQNELAVTIDNVDDSMIDSDYPEMYIPELPQRNFTVGMSQEQLTELRNKQYENIERVSNFTPLK